MTKENNIRAILETNFSGFKEEIINSAVDRLMEITEKVRHGRWITLKGYSNILLCSECNTSYEKKEFAIAPNYCPNCGALMDKEENDG